MVQSANIHPCACSATATSESRCISVFAPGVKPSASCFKLTYRGTCDLKAFRATPAPPLISPYENLHIAHLQARRQPPQLFSAFPLTDGWSGCVQLPPDAAATSSPLPPSIVPLSFCHVLTGKYSNWCGSRREVRDWFQWLSAFAFCFALFTCLRNVETAVYRRFIIIYQGRDSFPNGWSRCCLTFSNRLNNNLRGDGFGLKFCKTD